MTRRRDGGTLPDRPGAKLGIVELFAGAAGLAQGFLREGGYDLIALNDWEPSAKKTFDHNFEGATYLCEDIRQVTSRHFQEAADGRAIDGILGGPPCQGFSLAGVKDREDKRNDYIKKYAEFVCRIRPKFILLENVPQMLFHQSFAELVRMLSRDYDIRHAILNAARYGVPQTRHRAFVLGFRRDMEIVPTFPEGSFDFLAPTWDYHSARLHEPTDDPDTRRFIFGADPVITWHMGFEPGRLAQASESKLALVPVWDAISDLFAESGSGQTPYQRRLHDGAAAPANHAPRIHMPAMQKRMRRIGEGLDMRHDPEYRGNHYFSQAYGRLHRQGLARTITTFFCNPGSGRFLHPLEDRTITVREAARLQGFSDHYEFCGTQSEQMRLVGNAVPPILAQSLARHVSALLAGSSNDQHVTRLHDDEKTNARTKSKSAAASP